MKKGNCQISISKLSWRLPTGCCLLATFLWLFLFSSNTNGQAITKAEYFFDTDPGQGNGTAITFTPTAGDVTFTATIPTASLSQGFHFVGIRAKETGGVWSIFESRGFYITATTSDVPNIAAAEYFFDADPGNGNGTAIPVASGANVNFVVSVPTTSLSPGFHFLAIRTKGLGGRWGVFEARGFYITTSTTDAPNITAAEYFFDTDPGNGNGTSIPVTAGATTNFTVALPTVSLSPGFHFLAIRTKGANGKWGIFESRGFYVTGAATDAPNIAAAEYFFDTDPGNGNGVSIPITAGATSNFTATIPVTGLTPGFHFLAIRTKGADGKWGIFESRGFYVSPIIATVGDIVAAEYFIDTDPGEDNGIALTVNPTGPTINQIFPIAITGVLSGAHKLGFRVKDANGIWSAAQMETFTVLTCTTPVAPTAPTVSRCNSGTVTLNATAGATGTQVYRWYADATTSTVLFTGPDFTTPTLTASTDYFVSVFDPGTLCESPRTTVSAIVNNTSKPTLNATGNITLCEGGSFLLSAPAGFSTYTWSNGMATQQILVVPNGSYSVTVGNGTCTSLASDATTFTFSAKPAKPVVQASGPTNLCSGGSVTLSAPAGFTYLWSTGATTEQITVNAPGNYTVSVADGSNCPSDLSDPMIVTVSAPPAKPTLNATGSMTLCEGGSFLLTAPAGFNSYSWSNGMTTQQILVTANGSHFVSVGNTGGTCMSVPSDATTFTFSAKPAKPVVQASGPTNLCSGGSVTLSAPAGFTYLWSTGATTEQITVNASGNFTVRVADGSNCPSDLSDPMTVTVSAPPAKPVIEIFGNTALCGTNTVALLAPSGFAIYQWSGGQTTQGITVSAAGTHTLIVGNSTNCLSPASNSVTVTSTNQPCTGSGTPNSPPAITSTPLAIVIEGKLIFDLTTIVSDPDNNIDFTSLRVVGNTTSRGASASVSSSFELTVDYKGMPFTGIDRITIEVCDLSGACAQRVMDIDVVGEVEVFNGLTPDGDGLNDFMIIKYVDVVENAAQNKVTIYNRWGDVVFDIDNYDNLSRVFAGQTNAGKELPTGTYFYKIAFSNGKSITGFISLKR